MVCYANVKGVHCANVKRLKGFATQTLRGSLRDVKQLRGFHFMKR